MAQGPRTRRPGSLHDDERNGNGNGTRPDADELTGRLMRAVSDAQGVVEQAEAVATSLRIEHETYTRTVHALHRRVDELASLHTKVDELLRSHTEALRIQQRTERVTKHTRALVPVLVTLGEVVRYLITHVGPFAGH